jgi:hypothetical protein
VKFVVFFHHGRDATVSYTMNTDEETHIDVRVFRRWCYFNCDRFRAKRDFSGTALQAIYRRWTANMERHAEDGHARVRRRAGYWATSNCQSSPMFFFHDDAEEVDGWKMFLNELLSKSESYAEAWKVCR